MNRFCLCLCTGYFQKAYIIMSCTGSVLATLQGSQDRKRRDDALWSSSWSRYRSGCETGGASNHLTHGVSAVRLAAEPPWTRLYTSTMLANSNPTLLATATVLIYGINFALIDYPKLLLEACSCLTHKAYEKIVFYNFFSFLKSFFNL